MLRLEKDELNRLRSEFPKGTRVVLRRMNDVQAPPVGIEGTVTWVDDIGTIHVNWDNGCGLGLVYEEDKADKVCAK